VAQSPSALATQTTVLLFFVVSSSRPIDLDPSQYPRTYRVSRGYFAFLALLSALVAIPAGIGIWYFGTGHETRDTADAAIMVSICSLFVLLGAYLLASLLRFHVTLAADSIAVRNCFTARRVLRAEIAGFRVLPTQYISTVVVVPRDPQRKKLKFSKMLKADEAFYAWFNALPNLDAEDRKQSRAQLSADPDLGLTADQRADRVKEASRFAKAVNAIVLGAALWAWFYPRPYLLVIAAVALLPLVVIFEFVRSHGLYDLEGRRNEARPSVAAALLLPAPILAIRALFDLHLLRWQSVIPASVVAAVVLVVIVARTSANKRRISVPALVVFAFFFATYAGCVIADADVLLDPSSPVPYHAEVLSKSISHGRSTTYSLVLGPWGPRQTPEDVDVDRSVYDEAAAGDSVCVLLYPGRLKVPWFTVFPCR